ncbi:MAG: cupin domain-containing protein [Wenzhouxiangella sp.]|nr:cupin domain-containing protein [Wenzhouxiangella sp.]TVR95173.1 MAG: cupin domain-containing protein [Wenzhouxiangellaceae bacterium]
MILGHLDRFHRARFLEEFWQQRPCLISNWVQPDPLPLARLLELAEVRELPVRLVQGSREQDQWQLRHGPLSAADLPRSERCWTVLVQEVDKVDDEVAGLLDQFRFLPDWMLDDIMISDAVDGGSVGPHVDAYDVFLVQAAGQRRWELAAAFDDRRDPRFEIDLLASWSQQASAVLRPGQTLYLPAGVAHHGIALGHCQTWSVGLRTPSAAELMFDLAEHLDRHGSASRRLPVKTVDSEAPATLSTEHLTAIRQLLDEAMGMNDEALADFCAGFLTRWRSWPEAPESPAVEAVIAAIRQGRTLRLAAAARLALSNGRLYVNGEHVDCPPELGRHVAVTREFSAEWQQLEQALIQLCELDAIALEAQPQ